MPEVRSGGIADPDGVRRGQSPRRPGVRGRGARRTRRSAGRAVCGPGGRFSDRCHREGAENDPGGRVHLQRPEMPSSGEPRSAAERERGLRTGSGASTRGDQTEGHLRARVPCGEDAAQDGGVGGPASGQMALLPGHTGAGDLPSFLYCAFGARARPPRRRQAQGLG